MKFHFNPAREFECQNLQEAFCKWGDESICPALTPCIVTGQGLSFVQNVNVCSMSVTLVTAAPAPATIPAPDFSALLEECPSERRAFSIGTVSSCVTLSSLTLSSDQIMAICLIIAMLIDASELQLQGSDMKMSCLLHLQ